jgi:hypothetical protein
MHARTGRPSILLSGLVTVMLRLLCLVLAGLLLGALGAMLLGPDVGTVVTVAVIAAAVFDNAWRVARLNSSVR